MFIIEHMITGERQCVNDLAGYQDGAYRILEDNVTRPRHGHCTREYDEHGRGRWKIDRERLAIDLAPRKTRQELTAENEELKRRLDALESKLETVLAAAKQSRLPNASRG